MNRTVSSKLTANELTSRNELPTNEASTELSNSLSLKNEFKGNGICCENKNEGNKNIKSRMSGFLNIYKSINGAILAIKWGFVKFSLL